MRKQALLSAVAVIGLVGGLWTALDGQINAQAAGRNFAPMPARAPLAMAPRAQQAGAPAAAPAPSAETFRQYCVGCHNERMKGNFGNLSLEGLDPADASGHAEILEKVVRIIRKVQMSPAYRVRLDASAYEDFISFLATA